MVLTKGFVHLWRQHTLQGARNMFVIAMVLKRPTYTKNISVHTKSVRSPNLQHLGVPRSE